VCLARLVESTQVPNQSSQRLGGYVVSFVCVCVSVALCACVSVIVGVVWVCACWVCAWCLGVMVRACVKSTNTSVILTVSIPNFRFACLRVCVRVSVRPVSACL